MPTMHISLSSSSRVFCIVNKPFRLILAVALLQFCNTGIKYSNTDSARATQGTLPAQAPTPCDTDTHLYVDSSLTMCATQLGSGLFESSSLQEWNDDFSIRADGGHFLENALGQTDPRQYPPKQSSHYELLKTRHKAGEDIFSLSCSTIQPRAHPDRFSVHRSM